jgi:hypothetical protein
MFERSAQEKAEEYRRMATECIEIARRLSVKSERANLMGMAQKWMDMARAEQSRQLEDDPLEVGRAPR